MKKHSTGETIKKLADIQSAVGVFTCVLIGLLFSLSPIITGNKNIGMIIEGAAIALVGSWLSYLFPRILYGFGVIVSNTDRIAHDIHGIYISHVDKSIEYDYEEYYDELDQETT